VHDELRFIADRFLALCGATLGPLGERLDESLRGAVFARLEVRALQPSEVLINAGESIPSLFVVGGGRLEVVDASGVAIEELDSGAFVYPDKMMTAQAAPHTVRSGPGGALLLFAPRSVAHELMMSVPPLLEVLAG
jgi:signal-transduction protein with cAMP-binding, CBS, and nucleotidyltransferase domain